MHRRSIFRRRKWGILDVNILLIVLISWFKRLSLNNSFHRRVQCLPKCCYLHWFDRDINSNLILLFIYFYICSLLCPIWRPRLALMMLTLHSSLPPLPHPGQIPLAQALPKKQCWWISVWIATVRCRYMLRYFFSNNKNLIYKFISDQLIALFSRLLRLLRLFRLFRAIRSFRLQRIDFKIQWTPLM